MIKRKEKKNNRTERNRRKKCRKEKLLEIDGSYCFLIEPVYLFIAILLVVIDQSENTHVYATGNKMSII